MCEIPKPPPDFVYRYPNTLIRQRIQILDPRLSIEDCKKILDGNRWTFHKSWFYSDDKLFAMIVPPQGNLKIAFQNWMAKVFILSKKQKNSR